MLVTSDTSIYNLLRPKEVLYKQKT